MLETLANIKNDLDATADHLERLSGAMVGYTLFSAVRSRPHDVASVLACLQGIEASIQRLKCASSRIGQEVPYLAPSDPDEFKG